MLRALITVTRATVLGALLSIACSLGGGRPTAISTGDLSLRGAAGLTALQEFSRARGTVRLDAADLRSIDLPHLTEVEGDLILENVSARVIDLRRLRRVGGALHVIGATSDAVAEPFAAIGPTETVRPGGSKRPPAALRLSRLTSVGKEIVLQGLDRIAELHVAALERVVDSITVRDNRALLQVDLPKLVETGALSVQNNSSLRRIDLSALPKTSEIDVAGNRQLLGIDLGTLEVIDTGFAATRNRDLIALRADRLRLVGAGGAGDVVVTESDALQQVHFPALARVAGELVLAKLPRLTRIELEGLDEIGGVIDLRNDPALTDVLVGAARIGGGVDFEGSRAVTQAVFERLAWVGGDLIFGSMLSSLPQLVRLELPLLTEIGGRLAIYDTSLRRVSLHALKKAGSLVIERNPELRQLVLGQLAESGSVRVMRNALAGCLVKVLSRQLSGVRGNVLVQPDNDDCGRSLVAEESVARAVGGSRSALEQCLGDAGLVGALDPGEYELELTWTVTTEGGVADPRVDSPAVVQKGPAAACIATVMGQWTFPAAPMPLEIARHEVRVPVRTPWRSGSKLGRAIVESVWGVAPVSHEHAVTRAAFSRDGKRALTASLDHTLRVWDVGTQRVAAVLRGHLGPVRTAAFSPDGEFVLSGSEDQTVRVWNAKTGEQIARMVTATEVESLAVGPDGAAYVGGRDGIVSRWTWSAPGPKAGVDGDPRFVGNVFGFETWDAPLEVTAIAVDATGKMLAVTSEDGQVQLVPLSEGEAILLARPAGVFARIADVALSPDGRFVATAGGASGEATVRVWNAGDGQNVIAFSHDAQLYSVGFSPDGKLLYATSDTGIISWRVDDWSAATRIGPIPEGATASAWAPDGRLVLVGGSRGQVEFWDATRARPVRELAGHSGRVTALAAGPEGKRVASGSADQTVRLWNGRGAEPESTWVDSRAEVHGAVVALAIRDDEILSGNEGGRLKLWKAGTSGFTWEERAHRGGVRVVAFSSDGERMLSAGGDGRVILWDRAERRVALRVSPHTGAAILGAALSPDGSRVASVASQGTILLWDAKTGDVIRALDGHPDPVGLRFANGGRWLVSAGGRSIRLWDLDSGELLGTLGAHAREVFDLDVSEDGLWAATVGLDGVLRVWDLGGRRELASYEVAPVRGDYPTAVAFVDARRVLVGKQDGRIIRLRLPGP